MMISKVAHPTVIKNLIDCQTTFSLFSNNRVIISNLDFSIDLLL